MNEQLSLDFSRPDDAEDIEFWSPSKRDEFERQNGSKWRESKILLEGEQTIEDVRLCG